MSLEAVKPWLIRGKDLCVGAYEFAKTQYIAYRAEQKRKAEIAAEQERQHLLSRLEEYRKALGRLRPYEKTIFTQFGEHLQDFSLTELRRLSSSIDLSGVQTVIAARPRISDFINSMTAPNAVIGCTWSLGGYAVRHQRAVSDLSPAEANLYRWSMLAEIYGLGSSESMVMALCHRGNGKVYSGGLPGSIKEHYGVFRDSAIYQYVHQNIFPDNLISKHPGHPLSRQITAEINQGADRYTF